PVEDLACSFEGHHRRHGAELLTTLDVVEAFEVSGRSGIGQEAAMTQRARAVLAAPLEPGDDLVVGQRVTDGSGEVDRSSVRDGRAAKLRLDRVVAPAGAERSGGHRLD